ncbi:uncharacterized protein LOC142814410 [Rhipicephalus microplus]|uniref:uncharacterized protein LOC142814410 n=1 Tax=Rhipicephalus microplus TaxID=6941 RepID=UPI003F6BE4B6
MNEAVSAILSIPNPKVNYTLTVSLRLDKFDSSVDPLFGIFTLFEYDTLSHVSSFFEPRCREEIFARYHRGENIVYLEDAYCAFAASAMNPSASVSFETPRTLRDKMRETYRMIGYSRTDTHVVGWTVYNVTNSLASPECGGYHNRINTIREIIDENKEIREI